MPVKWGQTHHRLRPHLCIGACIQEDIVMSNKSKLSKTSQERQRDNRANQMNPNNDRYYWARGEPGGRPHHEGGSAKRAGPSP